MFWYTEHLLISQDLKPENKGLYLCILTSKCLLVKIYILPFLNVFSLSESKLSSGEIYIANGENIVSFWLQTLDFSKRALKMSKTNLNFHFLFNLQLNLNFFMQNDKNPTSPRSQPAFKISIFLNAGKHHKMCFSRIFLMIFLCFSSHYLIEKL